MHPPRHPAAWPSHAWLLAAQRDADLSFPAAQTAAPQSRGQSNSGLLTAPRVIMMSRESLPCPMRVQLSSLLHPLPSTPSLNPLLRQHNLFGICPPPHTPLCCVAPLPPLLAGWLCEPLSCHGVTAVRLCPTESEGNAV